jgi:hypothetical protein
MKEENNGRSANGRDFSSGWNCTPMNQALESNYLAAVAVGDRCSQSRPLPATTSGYFLSNEQIKIAKWPDFVINGRFRAPRESRKRNQ